MRRAIITTARTAEVAAYLPSNYHVIDTTTIDGKPCVVIEGEDIAGWTLSDYVLPRLASGMHFGEEVTP